ncbi:autotransporter domain-containing protein [Pseudomonas sp. C32]|uniref:autotransporter domain-containing protein n=1 Tax=Pseudomonas sp. C32 TaxID=1529208 RepID=UPI0026178295|nr:autotransporter domain-containing protein [Pseudomonas sp. C32]MDN4545235.1 autotransporter domain-containing protein [Pseudomonas sp. C32]
MHIQHRFRPKYLALAIALALGCTEYSSAQQPTNDIEPTIPGEMVEHQGKVPETDLIGRLQALITADTTVLKEVDSAHPATKGVSLKLGDSDDLLIIRNGASFEGRVDGGKGENVIQLAAAEGGGELGNTRNFDGLYVTQGTWLLNSVGDFKQGVLVQQGGTLTNNGKVEGSALVSGSLFNKGDIKGDVIVMKGGSFAGAGSVGSLDVSGQLNVDKLNGAPRVKGDLVISDIGVLAYEVSPDGGGETIKVSGNANIEGATLKVVALPGNYLENRQYTIIKAGSITGEFGVIKNDLAYMKATPRRFAKSVGLTFERNGEPIAIFATNDNGRNLAESIEENQDIPSLLLSDDDVPPDFVVHNQEADTVETPAVSPTTAQTPAPSAAPTDNEPALANSTPATLPPSEPLAHLPPDNVAITSEVTAGTTEIDTASIAAQTPTTPSMPTIAANPAPTTPAPTPATNPTSPAPKTATPTNAAVAAILATDKKTAPYAIEQLAGGSIPNLAKVTLNSDAPVSASMLAAMRQLNSAAASGGRKRAPQLAAGNEANGRVWLQALGHGGKLDRDFDTLKHSTQGLVMGTDWAVDHEWRIGLIGGKSQTRMDSRELDGDLDSWHLGAYALRQNGPMSLRLGATYSNHDGSTKRRVAFKGFSDRLEGQYDSSTQQAFAEVGYNLGRANTSIEPFAGLGYQRYQRNGYTEKGGAAALKVDGQEQNNLNSTFGLRLAKINTLDNGMQLTPRFSASWKHTYGEIATETRQRLITGGRKYTVSGAPLDRDSLMVDAGLELGLSARQTLGVGVNGEMATDSRNHGATAQWRMTF